jgi:hypothetical protein
MGTEGEEGKEGKGWGKGGASVGGIAYTFLGGIDAPVSVIRFTYRN